MRPNDMPRPFAPDHSDGDDLVQRLLDIDNRCSSENWIARWVSLDLEAAGEIKRLQIEVERYKVAWTEYDERTEWVQQTAKPNELGMHRADILRQRIEKAERELAELRERMASLQDAFEKAPVSYVTETDNQDMKSTYYANAPQELDGHRVRLVRED